MLALCSTTAYDPSAPRLDNDSLLQSQSLGSGCEPEMWPGIGVDWHCPPHSLCNFWLAIFAVQESLVSEEIVHDLDTCEVTVEGEELNPEQESLEVDAARLQQKGIEVSHSDLGVVFTGEGLELCRGEHGKGRLLLPAEVD